MDEQGQLNVEQIEKYLSNEEQSPDRYIKQSNIYCGYINTNIFDGAPLSNAKIMLVIQYIYAAQSEDLNPSVCLTSYY